MTAHHREMWRVIRTQCCSRVKCRCQLARELAVTLALILTALGAGSAQAQETLCTDAMTQGAINDCAFDAADAARGVLERLLAELEASLSDTNREALQLSQHVPR